MICFTDNHNLFSSNIYTKVETRYKQTVALQVRDSMAYLKTQHYTVKVVIFARSYFRDLPIFNCFACF